MNIIRYLEDFEKRIPREETIKLQVRYIFVISSIDCIKLTISNLEGSFNKRN